MNHADILYKTKLGVDEVRTRERKLPPRLRTLLILVDGAITIGEVQGAAVRLGAPVEAINDLLDLGLIAIKRSVAGMEIPQPPDQIPAANSREPAVPARPSAATIDTSPLEAVGRRQRFDSAKKLMNDTAVDLLGLRAFFFTLKLEKCFGLEDLRGLLPDYEKILTKSGQEEATEVLLIRLKEYLDIST